jgi:hypothetical protein
MVGFLLWTAVATAACDESSSGGAAEPGAQSAPVATPVATPAPEPPRAPEIIVDPDKVSVGAQRVATGEPALGDKVAAALAGAPAIDGHTPDIVAMRNAKPSQVAAVVGALRAAKATGVTVKTSARDDTTQKLPLSFTTGVPDCTVVIWIGKDGFTNVWPAGGGNAKRVGHGLAGPDMTLASDAVRGLWSGCGSPVIAVGADDAMSWGLVFDLGTNVLGSPGSRANAAVLLTSATPGKKLVLQ